MVPCNLCTNKTTKKIPCSWAESRETIENVIKEFSFGVSQHFVNRTSKIQKISVRK